MSEPYDSRFTLPSIDDAPSTEAGVILMGLDAERLLAGVGLARLADEPGLVALAVDQARHDALDLRTDALVEAGILRWRAVRPLIEAGPEMTAAGSLRREWEHTTARVTATVSGLGPASVACLAACWLRRDDVDAMAKFAEHGRAPEKGSGTHDVLSRVFAD
ncbi:DUF6187 family protein [Amycolatopsis alba]|uniref:Uncharacterized protein n=1 Tax=Amycolatopsis alba DSM 44262 TaxID=1125972 RepID=A0A229RBN4_AMYAL|nr:DUF6187 family protein [Amycolatopsis alba]OXM43995.1 hypothetical protein CFP75_36185 [Amycolatopsis alba DSM 44262]